MIDIAGVVALHETLIDRFGGSKGIRDNTLLESALANPWQTMFGVDLYPSPIEKAAVLILGIIQNHPFQDGNKRIGFTLGEILLRKANLVIMASEDEKYTFVISVAEGKLDKDGIAQWLSANTGPRQAQA